MAESMNITLGTPKVLAALHAVARAIAQKGIAKERRNKEQNFNFRGIDDAFGAFAPLLVEYGLLCVPAYDDLQVEARATKSGGTTYNVRLKARFVFTCVEDGSEKEYGPFYGEANDGQDKAVSKATSIAMRNMFFMSFVVPHEPVIGGDPDGQGEEELDDGVTAWLDAIKDSVDMEALNRLGDEIKEKAATIPADALKRIRTAWADRAKALQ